MLRKQGRPSHLSGDDGSQASGWGHHSASEDEKKGTVSEKTETGCSEPMQRPGGDAVAGGGGDHGPTERRGHLAPQAGRRLVVTHTSTSPRKNPWSGYQEIKQSLG